MKAIIFNRFGSSKELQVQDITKPEPKDDELLIRLSYSAVNPVDWKIREGFFGNAMPHEFPIIPGWDGSGTVAAIGKNVHRFKVGDEVYAYFRKPIVKWGTYAEYTVMPEQFVAPKPKALSFKQAASLPLVSLTAWQALFDAAELKPGETILIHAAAGGVGGMAVQFAHWKGARVFGTASSKNHEYVKNLGADVVIDYTKENYPDALAKQAKEGFDVIFDSVGGPVAQKSFAHLKKGARLVSIVDREVEKHTNPDIRCSFVFVAPNREELIEIGNLIDIGKIVTPEITEFPLKDAASAQDRIKEGHVRGKLVLKI